MTDPATIPQLGSLILEGLQGDDAKAWPILFGRAVSSGGDLSMVWPRFALWLLSEEVPKHTKDRKCLVALSDVAVLYREWCAGSKPDDERWLDAAKYANAAGAEASMAASAAAHASAYRFAADTAAALAASNATDTEDAECVTDTADAATDYAYAVHYDSDAAAFAQAARAECYGRMARKLLEIIPAA